MPSIKDLAVTSPAFGPLERIPKRHTGEGENVSPELSFGGVPEGTRQLALLVHDPDAPWPDGYTHWVVYGIPADADGIPEGGGSRFTEGRNENGDIGYTGCMPPQEHGQHHYYFWLYALDTEIGDGPGLTRPQVLERMAGHIIEQARLVGVYER